MNDINTGGSAFPSTNHGMMISMGMTLRDYFAAKAMDITFSVLFDALKKDSDTPQKKVTEAKVLAAESCYAIADAMLKARKT